MKTEAIMNEIARLQKQIDRKTGEIEEHKELIKIWQEKLNEPKK